MMDIHYTQFKQYMSFPKQNTWILISFDPHSVLTRQTSKEVAYKPGLDYLLECVLPYTFARINSLPPPLPFLPRFSSSPARTPITLVGVVANAMI